MKRPQEETLALWAMLGMVAVCVVAAWFIMWAVRSFR